MSDKVRRRTSETNRTVIIVALVAIIVGGALFFLAEWPRWPDWVAAIINNVGGLVVATGLITVAWELVGKRSFASEILAKVRLSTEIAQSGLKRITDQYLSEVDWAELIDGATNFDVVVAYAESWRNTNLAALERLAKRRGARIRAFLPDPDDELTVANFAQRFNASPEEVQRRIRQAIEAFTSLYVSGGADLRVFVRAGDIVFSGYRFDNSASVVTLYSHSRVRRSRVPTFVVGGGDLSTFVYDEVEAILQQSRQIFPDPTGGQPA